MDWSGVDYYNVLISCFDSWDDPLMSIDAISPNLLWSRNNLIHIFNGLRESTFSANLFYLIIIQIIALTSAYVDYMWSTCRFVKHQNMYKIIKDGSKSEIWKSDLEDIFLMK